MEVPGCFPSSAICGILDPQPTATEPLPPHFQLRLFAQAHARLPIGYDSLRPKTLSRDSKRVATPICSLGIRWLVSLTCPVSGLPQHWSTGLLVLASQKEEYLSSHGMDLPNVDRGHA